MSAAIEIKAGDLDELPARYGSDDKKRFGATGNRVRQKGIR
jgi:hypothetical protein